MLAVFRRVITFPVVSQEPTNFGSVFEIDGDFGNKKGIGIRRGRRLRGDGRSAYCGAAL
jgi:hypothetical protein